MKEVPHRNEQFDYIALLKSRYHARGNPVMSIDTKKKEALGLFYREGRVYTTRALQVYDHDFNSMADGWVIPHALYDLRYNTGFVNLGISRDSSEFACDSLRNWWGQEGQLRYPQATALLLLCDGGGSNHSRHYIFKEDLQRLANDWGLPIRVAHYPPYCSKYNPIEHRLFPHLTRACQGVIFHHVEQVKDLMARTQTQTGLSVTVHIIDKVYEKGRQASEEFKQSMPIVFDDKLPAWNYKAVPQSS